MLRFGIEYGMEHNEEKRAQLRIDNNDGRLMGGRDQRSCRIFKKGRQPWTLAFSKAFRNLSHSIRGGLSYVRWQRGRKKMCQRNLLRSWKQSAGVKSLVTGGTEAERYYFEIPQRWDKMPSKVGCFWTIVQLKKRRWTNMENAFFNSFKDHYEI